MARLLIDAVNVRSLGGVCLQSELLKAVARLCPKDSDVVALLPADGSDHISGGESMIAERVTHQASRFWQWNWYSRNLPKKILSYRADVLFSLCGIVPKGIQKICATVTTMNNLLPFSTPGMTLIPRFSTRNVRLAILRNCFREALLGAGAVVLHSEYALERLCTSMPGIRDKSYVALTGVPSDLRSEQDERFPHPYGERPYLFYLSALDRYKNHLRLIQAYRRAIDYGGSLPDLVLAGPGQNKSYLDDVLRTISSLSLEGRVKYIGRIDRAQIPGWLRQATVNVLPSTCEVNCVVVAEVLGVGGVLACSKNSSMAEVAADAAEFFDPYDPESIARTLIQLCSRQERRAELRCLAQTRSQELSWDTCGKAIWCAAEAALANFNQRRTIA